MGLRDLRARVRRMAAAVPAGGPGVPLAVVQLCPVGDAAGHPPGVYRVGPPGSVVGVLVYDPEAGDPVPPGDRVTSMALVIGGEVRPDPSDWDEAARLSG